MLSESAALPPRWIDVAPERFPGWIVSFAGRHGAVGVRPGVPGLASLRPGSAGAGRGAQETGPAAGEPAAVVFAAADGALARCHAPFPPAPALGAAPDPDQAARLIAAHAAADRTVGVLLVRLGGYAAGVFAGAPPRLAASKVGSRLVHGRSAAGGQSQQRFARRREKQAAEALAAAADTAAGVFGRYGRPLDALVLGGDRRAVAGLRDDPRLRGYFAVAVERFLTVPDPRLAVLRETPRKFRAIRVQLTEPAPPGRLVHDEP
jgi:Actinobacteria/chloroflexi VLRF1 release factor